MSHDVNTNLYEDMIDRVEEAKTKDPFKNLETGKYKICGYGEPLSNQEGDYDEVGCLYREINHRGKNLCNYLKQSLCGEIDCPLNKGVKMKDLSELLKEGRIEEFILRSAGYRIDSKPLCAMCGTPLKDREIGNGVCDTCKELGNR